MAARAEHHVTAIPLCLPNNCSWDSRTETYTKMGEKRSFLYIIDEALEKLRTIKGPVCVVSIAGPYRKGKSWLLSEAFHQPDVFPLGHTMDPETMGIWLWIVPDKIKDSNGKDCTVVLLDSEGVDSVKGKGLDDNQVFTLTVLLSSVLIYNSAGVPTRTDLNGLDFIVKLSQRIQFRSTDGGMNTTSCQMDDEYFHKTFPFFIWMLRDVTQSIPPDCKDIQDYFLSRVFDARGHSRDEESQKAAEGILRFFAGFRAFLLPPPTSDSEVLKNINKNRDKIEPNFLRGVEQFKGLLQSILIAKRTFNDGEIVTGEGLAALIKLYVDAINTPGAVPNIQSTWETFVQHKYSEVQTKALKTYEALMEAQVSGCLPCDNDFIRQAHNTSLEEGILYVEAETFGISSVTVEKCLNEFKESTDKTLSSWIRQNEKLTKDSCTRLLADIKRKRLDPVLAKLRTGDGCKVSFDEILQGYKRIKEDYDSLAKGAKDVCAAVFFEIHPELMREMEQYLGLLRQLKDFDENLTREVAAKAYQDQERKRLEEEYARLQQENHEREKEKALLATKLEEERQRLHDQFQAERKAQRDQMENMLRARMEDAEEERKAFLQENQSIQQRLLEMQDVNERMEENICNLQRQLIANQSAQTEVNRPGFFDKALRVVSAAAPVVATVAMLLPKCNVM